MNETRKETPTQRRHLATITLPQSPMVWLQEKRARDNVPPHLWRVEGQLYDLSTFQHPGGASWLQLTRGSDCTTAFHLHHINLALAQSVLKKYRVEQEGSKASDNSRIFDGYDWRPDGFYTTLQRRVFAAVQEHAKAAGQPLRAITGPTTEMIAWSWACVAACVASILLTAFTGSYLGAVLMGLAVHVIMGVGHNFFHQRDSWLVYSFDFSPFSSREWRISHAISHHMYPNHGVDIEASQIEPFLSFVRSQPPLLSPLL